MATLVHTPYGTWKALVRRRGWPTASRTFRLKRDATNWARHVEDEIGRSRYRMPTPLIHIPFTDAMNRYLREVSIRKRPRTHAAEIGRAKVLLSFFRKYALTTITPDIAAHYRDVRLKAKCKTPRGRTHKKPRTVAPATVRLELALLSDVFNVAIREWRIGLWVNPISAIRRPPPSPGRNRRLQRGEERKLYLATRAWPNPMVGWIFRVGLATAMRQGEILSLTLSQVKLTKRTVVLNMTKNGSTRTVPLSKEATQVLREAIANRDRPNDCDLVFFGKPKPDRHYQPYSFRFAWDAVRSRLGMDDLRFHDLRHEAISRLVEAGLSDQEVAAISGHKSMQMLRRYTHLRAEDLVRRLDGKPARRRRGSASMYRRRTRKNKHHA